MKITFPKMKFLNAARAQTKPMSWRQKVMLAATCIVVPLAGMASSAYAGVKIEVRPTPDGSGVHVQTRDSKGRIESGRIIQPADRMYRDEDEGKFDVRRGRTGYTTDGYGDPSEGIIQQDYNVDRFSITPEFFGDYRPTDRRGRPVLDCRQDGKMGWYCCPERMRYGKDGRCHGAVMEREYQQLVPSR